jgi:hypothetical protein
LVALPESEEMDLRRDESDDARRNMQMERRRPAVLGCDGCAQKRLFELRAEATKLVLPIQRRVRETFDAELNQVALAREETMSRLGLPIYEDRSGADLVKDGVSHAGIHREWKLTDDQECRALHLSRECADYLHGMFQNGVGGWTAFEVQHSRAIGTLTYFATSECGHFLLGLIRPSQAGVGAWQLGCMSRPREY